MRLKGRRNPLVAREGVPFLLLAGLLVAVAVHYRNLWLGLAACLLLLVLYLLFRDPRRSIPAVPLGVVSPVDGEVVLVDQVDHGVPQGVAHRIRIRVDGLGTYTARAPVEGKILDLRSLAADTTVNYARNALWLRTDEGDDVILQFTGYRFGLAPLAFAQYGERVGQGQRCAYLRLARFAEVHLPVASQVLVRPGQLVVAGTDLIGKVPHP